MRPHWDQVCREAPAGLEPVRITELYDTVGLGAAIRAAVPDPARGTEPPTVEVVSHYRTDGGLEVVGLWDATVDSATAEGVAGVVVGRARPLAGLLAPAGFRSRVLLRPTPRLVLGRSVECLPHIAHEEGRPPTGLPAGVRLRTGSARQGAGEDRASEVKVSLDERGDVVSIERVRGYERTFREAEAVIRGLRFDPALSNGVAIEGTTRQAIYFDRGVPTTEVGLDSAFLVRQGFDRRGDFFQALARWGAGEAGAALPIADRLARIAGVEVGEVAGRRQLFVVGAPCPVRLVVNGVLLDEPESPNRDPRLPRLVDDDTAAHSIDWVGGTDPSIGDRLSGVELFEPGAGVVPDPQGCGALLVWSRTMAGTRPRSFTGHIEGTLPPAPPSVRREVMADPGGFLGFVNPGGRFVFRSLHPGRYDLVVREDGRVVATGSVVVTALATTTVELGR